MTEDLEKKLLKDILKTGFPLEMEISSKLENEGWRVSNGSYYIDKDENKGREIDIIARSHLNKDNYFGSYLEVMFSLIFEIKKTDDKPWVFFTSSVSSRVEKILPKQYLSSGFDVENHIINKALRKNTIKSSERVGRNFYQGFTKNGGRDDIYKALAGVTKATHHFMQASTAKTNQSIDRYIHYFEPVIVIQGNLFEMFFVEGEMQLQESKYIQTNFNYLSPNYTVSRYSRNVVHIITKDYLEEFVNFQKDSLKKFFNYIIEKDIY